MVAIFKGSGGGGAIGPVSPGPRRPEIMGLKLGVRLPCQTMEWRDAVKNKGQQQGRPQTLDGCERALVQMGSQTMSGIPEAALGDLVLLFF